MNCIIKHNAPRQCQSHYPSERSDPRQATCSQCQPTDAPDPNCFHRNRSRRDRPLLAVLSVEPRIERVVEKHSPGVEKCGSRKEIRQLIDISTASQPPSG